MPQHEIKHCPRCGRPFECKAGNITACHCSELLLTEEQTAYIGTRFTDCLCTQCLKAMQFEQLLSRHNIKR